VGRDRGSQPCGGGGSLQSNAGWSSGTGPTIGARRSSGEPRAAAAGLPPSEEDEELLRRLGWNVRATSLNTVGSPPADAWRPGLARPSGLRTDFLAWQLGQNQVPSGMPASFGYAVMNRR
jgi:hypothetical protein